MDSIKALTSGLSFDINAEALAASLLENKEELSGSRQIMVRALGHINRAGGREVMNTVGGVFNAEGEELLYLDINRESLFDTLPEMLFLHQDSSYEDEVEKAQHLARQEQMARQFFLPFEEVFYQSRIEVEVKERSAIRELAQNLLRIYGLGNQEGIHENNLALALSLPSIAGMVGDLEKTSGFLTVILRKMVRVHKGGIPTFPIPNPEQSLMGEGILGIDLKLGDAFTDGVSQVVISVCDVSPGEVEAWLQGGNQRRFLEDQLIPFLIPLGQPIGVSIEINEEECSFFLDDPENGTFNILGYTTKIR